MSNPTADALAPRPTLLSGQQGGHEAAASFQLYKEILLAATNSALVNFDGAVNAPSVAAAAEWLYLMACRMSATIHAAAKEPKE